MRAAWVSPFLAATILGCAAPEVTEFVNITFKPSVKAPDDSTWTFDLAQCSAPDDDRVDAERLQFHLLRALERELVASGHPRADTDADFVVFYEFEIVPATDGTAEQGRGRIFIEDAATGRRVWRGERRAPLHVSRDDSEALGRLDRFVHELLQYTTKLEPTVDDE